MQIGTDLRLGHSDRDFNGSLLVLEKYFQNTSVKIQERNRPAEGLTRPTVVYFTATRPPED